MRKICVFTSTRADYGLLYWLMKGLEQDPKVELLVLCTGTHLCHEFGYTVRQIESDGFPIQARCEVLLASDTPVAIARSLGLAIMSYADTLARLAPDLLVLLGDRFETLGAATAASLCKVPIAHCHGGELTFGAVDEAFRHSISKMSHLHFPVTQQCSLRLQQLGEHPNTIFPVSALAVESLNKLQLLSPQELESTLDFCLRVPPWLATYHPVTLDGADSRTLFGAFLEALDHFPQQSVIFTLPNADADGRVMIEMVAEYVARWPGRCKAFPSLGHLRYLSTIAASAGVIGNSSSGILEAPSLKKGTVNIGDRQAGRERATSVIDCAADVDSICRALEELSSPPFQASLSTSVTPYGRGNASETIVPILRDHPLDGILKKRFYDQSLVPSVTGGRSGQPAQHQTQDGPQ